MNGVHLPPYQTERRVQVEIEGHWKSTTDRKYGKCS